MHLHYGITLCFNSRSNMNNAMAPITNTLKSGPNQRPFMYLLDKVCKHIVY